MGVRVHWDYLSQQFITVVAFIPVHAEAQVHPEVRGYTCLEPFLDTNTKLLTLVAFQNMLEILRAPCKFKSFLDFDLRPSC